MFSFSPSTFVELKTLRNKKVTTTVVAVADVYDPDFEMEGYEAYCEVTDAGGNVHFVTETYDEILTKMRAASGTPDPKRIVDGFIKKLDRHFSKMFFKNPDTIFLTRRHLLQSIRGLNAGILNELLASGILMNDPVIDPTITGQADYVALANEATRERLARRDRAMAVAKAGDDVKRNRDISACRMEWPEVSLTDVMLVMEQHPKCSVRQAFQFVLGTIEEACLDRGEAVGSIAGITG